MAGVKLNKVFNMAFLRRTDYLKQIRNDNLKVVIEDEESVRKDAELAAIAEMTSYLSHRYDTAKIFADLYAYDPAQSYTTGDRITFPDVEDDIFTLNADVDGNDQTISGISPVDDPTQWTKGDTRDALIKMHLVDITLYHLHSRINPRQIPDFRIERYRDCIEWLKMVASSKLNVNLPVIEPADEQTGQAIKWASNEKFNHRY